MKKIELISSLLITLALFSGCSDNKKEESSTSKNVQTTANVAQSSNIEVSSGADTKEIKVEPKLHDESNRAYYTDYAKNEPEKPRSVLDANLNVRSPYEKVKISMMVKRLSKDFILRCSACHDDYANGIIGPSLLGKSPEYIYDKIEQFRHDKSLNVLMSDLVSQMSQDEVKKIAQEIYDFNEEMKKDKE